MKNKIFHKFQWKNLIETLKQYLINSAQLLMSADVMIGQTFLYMNLSFFLPPLKKTIKA